MKIRAILFLALFAAGRFAHTAVFVAESGPGPSPSCFSTGKVFIVSSSHQDTGWMDTPGACRNFRIEHNIMPALEMMRKDPDYTFCMECTLHVMEFLEAHPELRGEMIQRMKEHRLEWGATYNQPYESWMSGEELIRETYYGRRWILKNLPGCDVKVAFNPDPPGRSLQMQQILSKAGIPYMFISRYHEGLYRWLSPDGTGVLLYTPGHYGNHLAYLNGDPTRCSRNIHAKLDKESSYYEQRQIPPAYCLVNSMDFSKPVNFSPLIHFWNTQTIAAAGGAYPEMSYSSIRGFFETIDKPVAKFDKLMGERPDVWVYITGPTHHELSSAKREAARLLPAAETFTTFADMLSGSFGDWPSRALDQAWKDEIYIDHGIGGKNGHITDEVFFSKVKNARDTGRALLDQALGKISAQVKTDSAKGIPVTVFNDLSWARSDVVEMDLPESVTGPIAVVDAAGNEIEHQKTWADSPDEINVAAATAGSAATADSVFSPEYAADKAIDGRWNVCDPNPETGSSAKWNSGNSPGPHWLTIDFGQPRSIHKVTIRHEGVMGVYGGETKFNTAAFQIQSADAATGPWAELVAPVTNKEDSLTVHKFEPKSFRFLRLFITKGAPGDSYARIYEVQAFEKCPPKPKLMFLARDVPPLGYKTFYVTHPGAPAQADEAGPAEPMAFASGKTNDACENDYYRVVLIPGGIEQIFDKQQNRQLLKSDRFLGGEVFTMNSYSPQMPDAGEAGAVVQPVMDASFDRVAAHKPEWKLVEKGRLRMVWQLEQPLADTTVRQRVILWNCIKRLDCQVDLQGFNGRLWREFRMALPLAMEKPKLAYEVPMGVVEIGKDELPTSGGLAYGGLNYFQQCRDIRPREVQDFVDASDEHGGLTMSSSVSVFDWVDPTTNAQTGTVLQPVLLASRKSCNGQGVWYPQAGDHTFSFSLTTHEGGWRNGRKPGIAANHPLQVVVNTQPAAGAFLPPFMSFASVSANNVIISTIKKCEDDDSVILRAYDIDGKDSTAAVKLFQPAKSAAHTSLIEEDGKPLMVKNGMAALSVGHHAIETIKLKIENDRQTH